MLEQIKSVYRNRTPRILGAESLRSASVMLTLIDVKGELSVLFQVRGHKLRNQPGEICFPGGRIEPGDPTEEAAAIRETCEELGIQSDNIEMMGHLDIFVTPHTIIYPFLCRLKAVELHPDPQEVHEVFTVPLDYLLNCEPELYFLPLTIQPPEDFPFHLIPGGKDYKWRKSSIPEYFYQYGDKVIWGITARILRDFLEKIKKQ
ncbi:MAG TPA: CoA pyrophosphatase [Bacillota bacterium]|nr:CoA pyrophosphatase [Bacillota bacterium]